MYLLQSWKDSLSLFKPKNFKLFALVTLKTIGGTYWLLLKYFWWLVVIDIAWEFTYGGDFTETSTGLIKVALFLLWTFAICLVVRPSVAKKNSAYFVSYIWYVPAAFAGMIVYALLGVILQRLLFEQEIIFSILILIPLLFFMFFLLDMVLNLRNWRKAGFFANKMVLYNIPTLILFAVAFSCVSYLLSFIQRFGHFQACCLVNFVNIIHSLVLQPIFTSIIGNLYIKRLHEQPQLYFKKPNE